ncbi:hypothetical protein LOZ53_001581 [Ophidiomyces ophidiicola]|nr:hypothetical protein LOZ55_000920 [Ophidiomyces ophidiicola]KAI1990500.1 hypothetical protein LOZ51_004851 [Ophidiomyces ophidiicola]KAI1994316.1 hypothetical protein LOZ54_000986 [Ophidiomyces ophidiicola]KAI1995009.1 hypothetical protein LOZ53_001581 [Ophidiomyces ophidiicola]
MSTEIGGGRRLVLCFDGTGNRYKGNESDTNVVKIYEMLDRHDRKQYHYYQPGIGTFTTGSSGSGLSWFGRMKATISQLFDQALGNTFEYHVCSGYEFLMKFYEPGDDIYIFGFSRGAYTARFLAEMIDKVGLLSQGNEEMVRFVFASFSQVQHSKGKRTKSPKDVEHEEYLLKFRTTFCRPEVSVHFLGLFDCVNSVSQFEIPFRRHSYEYIAQAPAKHIRHAVSIHERRLKFKPALFVFEEESQGADIKEVWFAGSHCDIGGGFRFEGDSKNLLSDIPLAWMIDEVLSLDCHHAGKLAFQKPAVERAISLRRESENESWNPPLDAPVINIPHYHDSLTFGGGESWGKTCFWWILEILPFFTRLELENGEWNPRYWPPNLGALRDIPREANIHNSVEELFKAGVLRKMPKLGGDDAPFLKDPLLLLQILMPWKWRFGSRRDQD